MTQPCEQATTINLISHTLERMENSIVDDRKERRETEKRIMDILEKVADQGARITYCEEGLDKDKEEIEHLKKRVALIETFHSILVCKPILYMYGVLSFIVLFGFVSDIVNHWDWIKSIFKIYNGNG